MKFSGHSRSFGLHRHKTTCFRDAALIFMVFSKVSEHFRKKLRKTEIENFIWFDDKRCLMMSYRIAAVYKHVDDVRSQKITVLVQKVSDLVNDFARVVLDAELRR